MALLAKCSLEIRLAPFCPALLSKILPKTINMNTETKPNDNAFPMVLPIIAHPGLTKRELFAALIYACGSVDIDAETAVMSADHLIGVLNAKTTTKPT